MKKFRTSIHNKLSKSRIGNYETENIQVSTDQQKHSQGVSLSLKPGWSEKILPLLFATMNACLISIILTGLADIGFLNLDKPLVPIWAIFSLSIGFCWLSCFLTGRKFHSYLNKFINGKHIILTINSIISILLALTFTLLTYQNIFQSMAIVIICFIVCLSSSNTAFLEPDPSYAFKLFRLSAAIIIIVTLVQIFWKQPNATFQQELTLFLLFSLFICLFLIAHTLASISYLQSFQSKEQKYDEQSEKRIVFIVISLSFVFILIAGSIASFISPTIQLEIQQIISNVYNWGTSILGHLITFIIAPIVWLLNVLHIHTPPPIRSSPVIQGSGKPPTNLHFKEPTKQHVLNSASNINMTITGIIFIIIISLLIIITITILIKRVQFSKQQQRKEPDDLHESLWSWRLFYDQFKAFLLSLLNQLRSLFVRRKQMIDDRSDRIAKEEKILSPTEKSIREIYRSLMRKAESRGFPRQRSETPFEFRVRLGKQFPSAETQLEVITKVYTTVRYSNERVDATQESQVIDAWTELEQQWKSK